jgi:hypothetical protein
VLIHRLALLVCGAALSVVCASFWLGARQEGPLQEQTAKAIYVGVLEDDRGQLNRLGPKDPTPVANRIITPAFEKDGSEWKTVASLNQRITWTVAFDGKKLGEVESEPRSQVASEKGGGPTNVQVIQTPRGKIPSIGKPQGRFNGNFGRLVRRPLIVVSRPHFSDPDHWARKEPPPPAVAEVRASFRKTFRHLRQCDASGEALKDDWKIPDSEIVVSKSYGSEKREFLIETRILHNKCLFNADADDFQSLGGNQIFYVAPDDRGAVFLGLQWEMVDAGDYDGDGKSEVIFYIAQGKDVDVETEGYVLFYDHFSHSVRFVWENH